MRKALAETFADPQFQAESKRLALGADAPQSGEQIGDVIRRVYAHAAARARPAAEIG